MLSISNTSSQEHRKQIFSLVINYNLLINIKVSVADSSYLWRRYLYFKVKLFVKVCFLRFICYLAVLGHT